MLEGGELLEEGWELLPVGDGIGGGDVASGIVVDTGGGGEPLMVRCGLVWGDGGGELDEVGAVVVAEGVAGIVFVEVEVAVEVDRVVAVFDKLEDSEVAGGVSELLIECGISGNVFPEVEMGRAEAVV